MSKKQQGTYRLSGGITVTDADLEADAQRFEAGECDGAWKVLPGRPQLFGEDTIPVGTRLPESLVRELDEAAGKLGQTRSELVRRFISDGLLALKAQSSADLLKAVPRRPAPSPPLLFAWREPHTRASDSELPPN